MSEDTVVNIAIVGDRALNATDSDRLGFRDVAKQIATSIVDRASENGMVVGLEGAWGSGKSSILFLIEDELGKLAKGKRPTVINFRPWLIGNREALIGSLFHDLSRQLDLVALDAGDASRITVAKAKNASKALQSFVSVLSATGSGLELAGEALGWAPLKWIGRGFKASGEIAKEIKSPPPLIDLKAKLAESLRDLGHRFIVTVDDVDRLEPAEVMEILRLVRSVADLPNIIYLLCYDGSILAHAIQKASGVESGKSYLEKIVQLTVMVPKPEPFQLRQWFSDDLYSFATTKDEEELSRLKRIVDAEGGRQLTTPRAVVRALDAIRFFWPPLRNKNADLADLVWLLLIKDGNASLYRWIEEYCATAALVALGIATVDKSEIDRMLETLMTAVPDGYFADSTYRNIFADQLIGLEANYGEEGTHFKLFGHVNDQSRDDAIRRRRICSPDHYRIYFALTDPSHALSQQDYTSTWNSLSSGVDHASADLIRLSRISAGGSLTKIDMMLERLAGGALDNFSSSQCEILLLALADAMDDAYRSRPFDLNWFNTVWDRAKKLAHLLIPRLDDEIRRATVERLFGSGKAIGWLTSLFRAEIFAHGRYGKKRQPDNEWLLTDAELDSVTTIMHERYETMSTGDFLSCPSPISLLFAWLQTSDGEGPRRFIGEVISSDDRLITILEHLRSTINSSDRGVFKVLQRDNLAPFLDFEDVTKRLSKLKSHAELGVRADQLLVDLEAGQNY